MTGIAARPLLGDVSGARSAAWLPRAAGCLTAVVGAINIISALTPELHGRLALIGHLAPAGLVLGAHALVLPAGLALLILYRFNAKLLPRWQPRYLLHEGVGALPRTALAAMLAEGQVPRSGLPALLLRPGTVEPCLS